jgi:TIR domain
MSSLNRPSNAVFISYRRKVSEDLAYAIYQGLKLRQIDPFFDYQNISAGRWLETILHQIAARPYFVLILAPGTLDRCTDPADTLLQEIQTAIRLERMIVPIITLQFDRADIAKYLSPEVAHALNQFQSLDFPASRTYYESAFDILHRRYLQPITLNVTPTPISDQALLRENREKLENTKPMTNTLANYAALRK